MLLYYKVRDCELVPSGACFRVFSDRAVRINGISVQTGEDRHTGVILLVGSSQLIPGSLHIDTFDWTLSMYGLATNAKPVDE